MGLATAEIDIAVDSCHWHSDDCMMGMLSDTQRLVHHAVFQTKRVNRESDGNCQFAQYANAHPLQDQGNSMLRLRVTYLPVVARSQVTLPCKPLGQ